MGIPLRTTPTVPLAEDNLIKMQVFNFSHFSEGNTGY
ncbi:hypothetical protein OROMI_014399 [Orobanche minor]